MRGVEGVAHRIVDVPVRLEASSHTEETIKVLELAEGFLCMQHVDAVYGYLDLLEAPLLLSVFQD